MIESYTDYEAEKEMKNVKKRSRGRDGRQIRPLRKIMNVAQERKDH